LRGRREGTGLTRTPIPATRELVPVDGLATPPGAVVVAPAV
jgi:hypothetical protein